MNHLVKDQLVLSSPRLGTVADVNMNHLVKDQLVLSSPRLGTVADVHTWIFGATLDVRQLDS